MLEILIKKGEEKVNLDLFDDETVNLNFSINTIKDISNTSGSYTKTIILPNTPNNREIFGFVTELSSDTIYNYETNNDYNPNKKVKCYILEDSLSVMEGYIQLNRYSLINNYSKNLEATIYGDNTSFFIAMGDLLLTDMDFSEYNFRWNRQTITQSWTNDKGSYQKGVYFPLIDYGHGWTYDDLTNLKTYSLDVKDFLPAVYIKTIWDKIFKSNGFNYSSNFLGTSVTGIEPTYPSDRFGNLIIPFNQQIFQNTNLSLSDKRFYVGMTFSDHLSQYTTYSTGFYLSKYSSLSLGPKVIPNADATAELSDRYNWYNGYLLNPFVDDPLRNDFGNDTYIDWHYATFSLSMGLTSSPFGIDSNGTQDVYSVADRTYTNVADDIYKQRFVLETDVVTNYSIKALLDDNPSLAPIGPIPLQSFGYIMKVEFFRSNNPITGLTDSTWAGGYGFKIPANLGTGATSGGYTMCQDADGNVDKITHWIKDINHKSNCFTKEGKLIVPTTSKRYLGDYCTSYKGDTAVRPTGLFATFSGPGGTAYPFSPSGNITGPTYKLVSGNCVSWYYNDGYSVSGTSSANKGMWVSGINGQIFDSYSWVGKATHQPYCGDWYQGLQLSTIYLDGDLSNPYYGEGGIYLDRGNTPIQPGEKVRCVVTFGSKYAGQAPQSSVFSYKPPVCATLLSSTKFTTPVYSYTSSNYSLTRFYNEVSTQYISGQLIDFNTIIPTNIKQRDFIQEIIRMHNLYLEPYKDNNKYPNTLVIEPRDDYYNLSKDVLDWRDKVDIMTPINIQIFGETQYKRTRFTYKEDADYYNKAYKQDTNEIYGQFIYSLDNQFLTNELKIESAFAATPLSQLFSKEGELDYVIKEGGVILPVYLSSDGLRPATNGNPTNITTGYRIMLKKYIDIKNGDGIYMFSNLSPTATNVLNLKYPYAGPYDDPYTPQYSINWGQTVGEFFATPTDQFSDNLVNTYWSSLLSEMGDADSRLITCKMFLNVNDINNFYFYKQVFLSINDTDGYYKVVDISGYIPGKNALCTVTFLRSKYIKNTFIGSNNH